MTDQFEARLRGALHQAARQLEVPAVPWRGPAQTPRRRLATERLPLIAAVAVAVIVAVVVVALIGGRHHVSPAAVGTKPLPSAPATAFEPKLPQSELHLIGSAYGKVAGRDRACRGFQGPNLTNGTPSAELTSLFSVLREPGSTHGRVVPLLDAIGPRPWTSGAQIYLNQIHLLRAAFGGTFYILPAGNITGQRGVPARCQAEQVTALKRQLARTKPALRDRILAGQLRYLAYLHYLTAHPEGICAIWIGRTAGGRSAGGNFMCGGLANFERWGIMADAASELRGHPVFWTVVPDVVASVTLRFDGAGTPQAHPVTMTVRPVHNIVDAVVPHGRSGSQGAWADAFPSTIVLRNRSGQVIRSYRVTPNMPTLCGFSC